VGRGNDILILLAGKDVNGSEVALGIVLAGLGGRHSAHLYFHDKTMSIQQYPLRKHRVSSQIIDDGVILPCKRPLMIHVAVRKNMKE
jgi:hypothetical protein